MIELRKETTIKKQVILLNPFHLLLPLLLTQAKGLTLRPSDSGIIGPKYAQLVEQWEDWRKASNGWLEVGESGKSPQNRPLRLLFLRKPGDFGRRPAVLLSGNMHGGEYLQLEDRLPLEFLNRAQQPGPIQKFLDVGGAIVMVPVANPDGYDSRSRNNSHGKDLNRDWPLPSHKVAGFAEEETSSLGRALDALTGSPYQFDFKVAVDYHCCLGAVLYPWSNGKALSLEASTKHRALAQKAKDILKIEIGTTGELLGYFPLGTAKDYYHERFGAISLTYEGREGTEKDYLPQHVAWWESIMDSITPPRTPKT